MLTQLQDMVHVLCCMVHCQSGRAYAGNVQSWTAMESHNRSQATAQFLCETSSGLSLQPEAQGAQLLSAHAGSFSVR